ncbi:MAG: YveK family protein [Patescibacteria group bacterium]
MKEFFQKIRNKWQTIALITFLVTALVFSISAFIPPKYSSKVRMIIIQHHSSEKVDAFSAAKSAEYLSDIIAKVVYTDSFLKDVLDSPVKVKKEFPQSSEEKMEAWSKAVDIDKINNTGILEITVFDKSGQEAKRLADSVAWSLNVRGDKYHGGGDSVEIKTISGPITSQKPAKPNLLINTLLGFVLGLVGSLAAVYYLDNFDLRFWEKRGGGALAGKMFRRKKGYFQQEEKDSSMKQSDSKKENSFQEEASQDYSFPKKETSKQFPGSSKKAGAPMNLPTLEDSDLNAIFAGEEDTRSEKEKGFISTQELDELANSSQNEEKKEENQEATEEEIKERLNRLLKGDL